MIDEESLRGCATSKLLACENIRFSSLFAVGDVSRTFPPRETSPAAKSEEKRMFSQATKSLFIHYLFIN